MERETSMVFYRGFKESIDNCLPEERLAIYEAIMDYALNGTLPDLSGGSIKLIWPLIQPQLDANRGRRKNGRKGQRDECERQVRNSLRRLPRTDPL